jgi:hypothetical protein
MGPHRAAAQFHKGVVTVTGVPAAEGEMVQVIVIRGTDDTERSSPSFGSARHFLKKSRVMRRSPSNMQDPGDVSMGFCARIDLDRDVTSWR